MPTVYIDDMALRLPPRCKGGTIMDDRQAAVLDDILHRRVRAKLRWLLSRGEIRKEDLQAKAIELCDQPLSTTATLDDSDEFDPILTEAMDIARELIVAKFAKEGLPLPKGLELHVKAVVDNTPAIQERARQRIEARLRAVNLGLNGANTA